MAVHRPNHALLYVPDGQRSAACYADALGFAGPV